MSKPTPGQNPSTDFEALLEAYLDGRLTGTDEQRVMERISQDPDIAARVELQGRIDDSLKRMFGGRVAPAAFEPPRELESPATIGQPPVGPSAETPSTDRQADSKRRWLLAGVAVAASLAWLSVLGQLPFGEENPYQRRDLAKVYRQTVSAGFEPRWVCEDDAEFASTFADRLGVPLQLSQLPEGRRMVGLSYLDGLSPNATSMLAYVNDQPVIVFVTNDREDPRARVGQKGKVTIHRTAKLGLVFYEVTPFDEPLITPLLESYAP